MAADEALNVLKLTDSENTPAGGDSIAGTLDDELRSIKANIARSARWEATTTASAASTMPRTVLHKLVPVDATTAGFTVTLPDVTDGSMTGFAVMFTKTNATNTVTLDGSGAQAINGGTTYALTAQYESVLLVADITKGGWYAAASGGRTSMDALTVDGASTLSGAVVMKAGLTVDGGVNVGTLTASATAVFKSAVTMEGAVVVTGDADFQGATNVGTLTASATAVFKSKISVSATASVGALTIAGTAVTGGFDYEFVETKSPGAADSALDFTDLASGHDHIFVFEDILFTGDNANFAIRTSPDTGGSPTFDTGASDYNYRVTYSAGSVATTGNTTSFAAMIPSNLGNQTNEALHGELTLYNPGSTGTHTKCLGNVVYADPAAAMYLASCSLVRAANAAVNAVRFFDTTGDNYAQQGSIHHFKRKLS
jgi:hypothetical protein